MISEGTDSGCNLYSVTTGWMLFTCLLSFGRKDYEDHGTIFLCQTEESATLYKHCNRKYGHFRLKIGGISRLTLSQRESSPCSELYCSQLPTFSKSSSMICLFGDVVRFYFIVLRPLWSASRCQRFMTVAYPLNKQSLQCHQHLVVWGRIQSSLMCAVGSQDVFIWLFIGQVRTVTDKRFWRYTCPLDKW